MSIYYLFFVFCRDDKTLYIEQQIGIIFGKETEDRMLITIDDCRYIPRLILKKNRGEIELDLLNRFVYRI